MSVTPILAWTVQHAIIWSTCTLVTALLVTKETIVQQVYVLILSSLTDHLLILSDFIFLYFHIFISCSVIFYKSPLHFVRLFFIPFFILNPSTHFIVQSNYQNWLVKFAWNFLQLSALIRSRFSHYFHVNSYGAKGLCLLPNSTKIMNNASFSNVCKSSTVIAIQICCTQNL